MRRNLITTALLIISLMHGIHVLAADKQSKKLNPKKAMKLADTYFKEGKVYDAADMYEKVMTDEPENVKAAYFAGKSYMIARDYVNAERCFKSAMDVDRLAEFPDAHFLYASMMKMNGKYDEAKKQFDLFRKGAKGEEMAAMRKWAQNESDGCAMAVKLPNSSNIKVSHLGKNINSYYSDVSPSLMGNSLIYSSVKLDTVLTIQSTNENVEEKFFKMMKSDRTASGYSNSQPLTDLVFKGQHVTNGIFSADGKKFYFTVCEALAGIESRCDIYVASVENGSIKNPVKLPATVNKAEASNTQPAPAKLADGSDVLYFISNREGGKGGMDIWYSVIDKSNNYKEAKNASSKINTDRDEFSPFFDARNKLLYFSSNGRIGMGGFDVFSASGEQQKWSDIQNAGKPVNSAVDDIYYRLNDNGDMGYVVSNRSGTMSVRSATCCYDIFEVKYDKVINLAVMGYVYDAADASKKPLSNSLVSLNIKGGGDYGAINSDSTEGSKPYFFRLNPGEDYKVIGSRAGYLSGNAVFSTKGITTSDTLFVDIPLSKIDKNKAYRLNNIYYDFDKWDLRPESKKTLDSLYQIMQDNPTIIVELGSHTDSRGSDAYNLELSQKRAESCVNYLIKEKGIPAERIKPKGYGETKHLDDCSKYPDCPTSSQGDCACHQLNRRTEFKIIGELDASLIYEDKRVDE